MNGEQVLEFQERLAGSGVVDPTIAPHQTDSCLAVKIRSTRVEAWRCLRAAAVKKAQAEVLDGEESLRIAAATTSDFAIITTDEAGTISTWNTGAERVFGYRCEEIIGRSIATIFTPEDRAAGVPDAEMRLAFDVGRAEDEGWRQRKDGTTIYCSGVLTRLERSIGKGFAKIARDLTGSKRHELTQENALLRERQASSEARRDVEMKDRFLAVMSHELK